ncbi:MAG: TM2 domain-containing protein [Clostridiaceae bacterium]|nr:TM2 domain-containing protein [Clostridiaceae bacterium]
MADEKSKFTLLILCIFLGVFGGHRFYANDKKGGILYLFTFGLLFFGVIYDLVKILQNKFCDEKGCAIDTWNINPHGKADKYVVYTKTENKIVRKEVKQ